MVTYLRNEGAANKILSLTENNQGLTHKFVLGKDVSWFTGCIKESDDSTSGSLPQCVLHSMHLMDCFTCLKKK